MSRRRWYHLFGLTRQGPFTVQSRAYPDYPYLLRVRAVNVKQAYYFAHHGIFATEPKAIGIHRIDCHGTDHPVATAEYAT